MRVGLYLESYIGSHGWDSEILWSIWVMKGQNWEMVPVCKGRLPSRRFLTAPTACLSCTSVVWHHISEMVPVMENYWAGKYNRRATRRQASRSILKEASRGWRNFLYSRTDSGPGTIWNHQRWIKARAQETQWEPPAEPNSFMNED